MKVQHIILIMDLMKDYIKNYYLDAEDDAPSHKVELFCHGNCQFDEF